MPEPGIELDEGGVEAAAWRLAGYEPTSQAERHYWCVNAAAAVEAYLQHATQRHLASQGEDNGPRP